MRECVITRQRDSPPYFFAPRRFPELSRPFFVDPPPRFVAVRIWMKAATRSAILFTISQLVARIDYTQVFCGKSCCLNPWQTDVDADAMALLRAPNAAPNMLD